jgi:hypothetical protein
LNRKENNLTQRRKEKGQILRLSMAPYIISFAAIAAGCSPKKGFTRPTAFYTDVKSQRKIQAPASRALPPVPASLI